MLFSKATVAELHTTNEAEAAVCKHNANFDVDYVIIYRYDHASIEPQQAEANFSKLIHALANAGLYSTVREGTNSTLLVFVKANKRRLIEEVYYSRYVQLQFWGRIFIHIFETNHYFCRVKDWLYGICHTASETESLESISSSSLTDAEKLRNVYHLIVHPVIDGGAGITPNRDEWEAVESIFPLRDYASSESWLANWIALVRKVFILDFLASLLPILIIAFVYLPFGSVVLSQLDSLKSLGYFENSFGVDIASFIKIVKDFVGNSEHLKSEIVQFAIIGQIVNLINEMVIPFLKGKGGILSLGFSRKKKLRREVCPALNDSPEEANFLSKVRQEAQLDKSSTHTNSNVLCDQFSSLSLLSCIWPLTAVFFLLGDWLELRSDALKICHEMKRPIPCRFDSFGPWRHLLSIIAGFSILCSAALIHLFSNYKLNIETTPWSIQTTNLLLALVISETLYLFTRFLIRIVLGHIESSGLKRNHNDQYLLRKCLLEESFASGVEVDEAIKNMEADLEMEKKGENGSDKFWLGQGVLRDTIRNGVAIFARGNQKSNYKKSFPRPTRIPTTPSFKLRQ